MRVFISILFAILVTAQGQVFAAEVVFHPYDDSLNTIVKELEKAKSTIDLALYNIDMTTNNPVVAWLALPSTQARMKNRTLKVRLLFEGYDGTTANEEKLHFFEGLGIDAKILGRSQKMHHKFAVIDGYSNTPLLVTGSANWSLGSQNFYSENILFLPNQYSIAWQYLKEYELLWENSQEYGQAFTYSHEENFFSRISPTQGISAYFNTNNYNIVNGNFEKKPDEEGYTLTRKIVAAIDASQSKIEIATTRIKLRPVYNAILRAARRGVKVQIVVSMQSYDYPERRKHALMRTCLNEYNSDCSTSQDFALLLNRNAYIGKDNVEVRIKYYHVDKGAYLSKQMHSKYIIIDDKTLLTGSFNWSYSAEYGHIENLLQIDRPYFSNILFEFHSDFYQLWNLGRNSYHSTIQDFENKISHGEPVECEITPMTLTYNEIDYLLDSGRRVNGSLSKSCK
ncbi:MAG: hypothetical protein KDD34_01610 [Bdellovibrionales bacterium]|nr:hypothetical protein [Bdellovibrionales bacterium]